MGWIKLDDSMDDHPKFVDLPEGAPWLFVRCLMYAHKHTTNGEIPRSVVKVKAECRAKAKIESLVERELLHPCDGGYLIHDYLDWQQSSDDIAAYREKGRSRIARFRKKRKRKSNGVTPNPCNADVTLTEGEGEGEEEREGEIHTSAITRRPDVDELCSLLAELVIANGTPAKNVKPESKGWRDAARLMLDSDGRNPAEAEQLIRWCQASEFWRSNIRSMPTFREQYDQLRLQSERSNGGKPTAKEDLRAKYRHLDD